MERNVQQKTRIGLLIILGLLGVLSMLTNNLPVDSLPTIVLEKFTVTQLRFLSLINPTVLLLVAIAVGSFTHVSLDLRTFSLLEIDKEEVKSYIKIGLLAGLISFVLVMAINLFFRMFIEAEITILDNSNFASPWARIFYGGFTEEILLRFGFMTFIVWLGYKITRTKSSAIYWIGIVLAASLFALGHFSMVFLLVKTPSFSLLTYIFLGNFIGGVIFGWLYWKRGLDIAFIAHIVFHLCLLIINTFASI